MIRVVNQGQRNQLKKGVRVYWHDPDTLDPAYNCSGFGLIAVCNPAGDTGNVETDTIVSLCMDDGSYVECYPRELSLLEPGDTE